MNKKCDFFKQDSQVIISKVVKFKQSKFKCQQSVFETTDYFFPNHKHSIAHGLKLAEDEDATVSRETNESKRSEIRHMK